MHAYKDTCLHLLCSLTLCVTIISVVWFETPVPGVVHNSVYLNIFLRYTVFSGSGLIEPCGPIRACNQEWSQAQPPGLYYTLQVQTPALAN